VMSSSHYWRVKKGRAKARPFFLFKSNVPRLWLPCLGASLGATYDEMRCSCG
jgi:hypothetical protein